ncbi:hypothetical protein NFI96_029512, partial [Prochilodus magdalenae]
MEVEKERKAAFAEAAALEEALEDNSDYLPRFSESKASPPHPKSKASQPQQKQPDRATDRTEQTTKVMDPITIATSATAIIAGASLVGTSIDQISRSMDTWRNATIQITNHSETSILANPRWVQVSPLRSRKKQDRTLPPVDPLCHTNHFLIPPLQPTSTIPPQPTINRRTKEACSFSKTPHTARGSVGVLTYQILRNGTYNVGELAIMFSVPYDYNLYENTFALGIYQPNISCDDDLFNKMYYSCGPFTRGKGSGSVIEYSGEQALVRGTMSAFGQSVIKVEFWDKWPHYLTKNCISNLLQSGIKPGLIIMIFNVSPGGNTDVLIKAD